MSKLDTRIVMQIFMMPMILIPITPTFVYNVAPFIILSLRLFPGRDIQNQIKMAATMAADARKTTKMKSKSYGDVIINNFDNLRKNDELCDFTVSAQGKSIRVSVM